VRALRLRAHVALLAGRGCHRRLNLALRLAELARSARRGERSFERGKGAARREAMKQVGHQAQQQQQQQQQQQ
jgi:hypothetical protein